MRGRQLKRPLASPRCKEVDNMKLSLEKEDVFPVVDPHQYSNNLPVSKKDGNSPAPYQQLTSHGVSALWT
jgi:hypothetical protein